MNARQVAVEAVKAADEFFARRLWQRLANEEIVGIELADRPPIAACIMGAARKEFGLYLLVGERAVAEMLAIGRGRLAHRSLQSPSLSFSLTRRIDIDPPFDRVLVEARRQGRMAPLFLCVERGQAHRPPRKQEYEALILAARALLIADAAGRLDPGDAEVTGRLLTLQVTGALQQPDVAVALHSIPPPAMTILQAEDVARPPEPTELPSRSAPEPSSPDDLDAWKAVDLEVTHLIVAAGARAAMTNDKAWRRYLGVDRSERDAMLEGHAESLITGYLDWYSHHYRATKRSRTVAERVLASDLSPPVRSTLQSRQSARYSLYRVEGIRIGEGVELHDLLADRRCFVTDRSISMTAKEGVVFPARLYGAGGFSFGMPAGPVMSGVIAVAALDFLAAEHGLRLGDAVDPDDAHLLGRLWSWVERQGRRELILQNRDGHALFWHTVRFSIADPQSLARALEARADIEVVEPGSEWIWHRDGVHLGQLELFGGEALVLEVNSAERYLAARRWLEPMAGVTLASVEKKELDPRRASSPLDDRLPRLGPIDVEEIPPQEALEIVQRMVDENCMRWLDESIPMLGGKSPRQTCETGAGRRRIMQLIRTYPDPMGVPGVRVPRDRMLAELGLGRAKSDDAAEG